MAGGVDVDLREPHGRSRDHTERLLRAFGFTVADDDGWIRFQPTGRLEPFDMQIPGDPSSAAFPVGAAILAEGGELRIAGVGVNPTRIGFLGVLARMGAAVTLEGQEDQFHEPIADLIARPAMLRGTEVAAGEIPGLIDEIPLLAALATRARATTIFREVGELRVKESTRLGIIARHIQATGGTAEAVGNDLHVEGSTGPLRGKVYTDGDHRIAMAFAVLGNAPGARIRVGDMACAAVSFPGFPGMLTAIQGSGKR